MLFEIVATDDGVTQSRPWSWILSNMHFTGGLSLLFGMSDIAALFEVELVGTDDGVTE